jgi:hypothetical protein
MTAPICLSLALLPAVTLAWYGYNGAACLVLAGVFAGGMYGTWRARA